MALDQSIPDPHVSTRGVSQRAPGNSESQATKWSLRGLLLEPLASVSLYALRLIDRTTGKAYSADELFQYFFGSEDLFVEFHETDFTFTNAHKGKVIVFTADGGSISVEVPIGLSAGFNAGIVRRGSSTLEFTPNGVTVNSVGGILTIADQHGTATLSKLPDGTFNLSGHLG